MTRRARFWYACGILALSLLAPQLSHGEETPGIVPTLSVESEAPQMDISPGQEPMTLEELKKVLKPQNKCGVPCGPGLPKCHVACGGAAVCDFGFCHPLP